MQPNTTMTPTELRADIPAFKEGVYLNFGAHGPSPEYVVDAADEFVRTHEYESPVGDDPYETAFQAFDRTRERVATFVGAEPDEIALTESTTAGINAIANAIDWQSGDLVVRTDLEHPAGILPWQRLEREGVEVRVVETKDGRIDPDRFAEAVADARLACFSAVTWTHGTQLPVAELVDIAHDAGALALVDAVQVPGQLPMDVAGGALTLSPPPATSGCSGCGAAASSTSTVTLPRASSRGRSAIGVSRHRPPTPTSTLPVRGGSRSDRRTRHRTSRSGKRSTRSKKSGPTGSKAGSASLPID